MLIIIKTYIICNTKIYLDIKLRVINSEDDNISTVYNKQKKHSWYYNGPSPTLEDHKIMIEYLKNRFNNKIEIKH